MDMVTYMFTVKKAKKLIDEHLQNLPIATEDALGAVMVGGNLSITDSGVLTARVTEDLEVDNHLPISSAAVYAVVGDIESLLAAI